MKARVGVLLVVVSLLMFSCAQMDPTAATNKAASERFTTEVWNGGNLDVLDEVAAADFVRHNPESWDPAMISGLDAMKEYITEIRTTYPDFSVDVGHRLAEGDLVAASWTVTGTHNELGMAVEVSGMTITRYQEGKAVEEWVTWDTQSLAEQLMVDSDMDSDNMDPEN